MGAAMRPGRRITYRVRVVSPTALLYNSHLPQVANPTAENPKASSTSQMGKGWPWPGFASRTLPRRKEGRKEGEGGALARVRLANSAPAEGRKEGRKREREHETQDSHSTPISHGVDGCYW